MSVCNFCKLRNTEMFKCSKCNITHYCSKVCQKVDWSDHKSFCGRDLNQLTKENDEKLQIALDNIQFLSFLAALSHYNAGNESDSLYNFINCKVVPDSNSLLCEIIAYKQPIDDLRNQMIPGRRNVFLRFKGIFLRYICIGFQLRKCKEYYDDLKGKINFDSFEGKISMIIWKDNCCSVQGTILFSSVYESKIELTEEEMKILSLDKGF